MPNQFGFDFSGGLGTREPILIQFRSVGIGFDARVDGGILVGCRADMGRLKFGQIVSPLDYWLCGS